jgi:glutathione synthase/RimK-type ligase-like ATP-grasp enzyme
MRRVAYLTSADMVPGAATVRDDLFELELQLDVLVPACAARGIQLELRVWDDPTLDKDGYDAVVVGTTWDYTERAAEFLDRMDALAERCPVLNPPNVLRWNADKRYLVDLAKRGVPTVPTVWLDRPTVAGVHAAVLELGVDQAVVKAVVGACAIGQSRVGEGHAPLTQDTLPRGQAMVQPFLPSIQTEGELSVIFCGEAPCHALQKVPAAGDYRVQSVYGGREHVVALTPDQDALARRIIYAIDAPVLYGRVDLVRAPDGSLRLMELELIEPYLYPEQGPLLGDRYASALDRLLE